jgi:imidazolonepropionase-like amidohydrolase
MAAPLKVSGVLLPEGEPTSFYVVDGIVTFEHRGGAEPLPQGWIVPGLVDAHNHIGMSEVGAVDEVATEQQILEDRAAGVLLIRDCGSAADTRWIDKRTDLPHLIRAGRHIARTKRYLRGYAHEIEPEFVANYAALEAQRGDGWVKLVGDWINRETGELEPSFPAEVLPTVVEAAQGNRARVTAHCFGADSLRPLVEAGIDCIEHGTGLTEDVIEEMARRGVALVPTVLQTERFLEHAAQARERYPRYAAAMELLYTRRGSVLMAAYEAGVPLYAGSDGGGEKRHGNLPAEIIALSEIGLPTFAALGAGSWRARDWLGFSSSLGEGAEADFLIYPRDPLADLSVLWEPSAIVLRGQRITP